MDCDYEVLLGEQKGEVMLGCFGRSASSITKTITALFQLMGIS